MEKKLFLIDGHSLIFRMYYAFMRRPMINSRHRDVSILFGFTKYILELIAKEGPTHMAVAFDPPGKTFRHTLYPEYKANRQATPELVIEALEPLVGICRALGLPVLMRPGFEGDDVLGSMAVQSAAKGYKVYMVTPDKDFGQLITDSIFQLKPGKSGGENEILGPKELCVKLGIQRPSQVVDMLALCGDSADNVPGVKGIGEVGAAKLIGRYGTIENIYAHLDELSPRQAGMFREAEDHIALSKQLVTIKTDIEMDISDDELALKAEQDPSALELFDLYEFASLRRYLNVGKEDNANQSRPSVSARKPVFREVPAAELVGVARKAGSCAMVISAAADNVFAEILKVTMAVIVPEDASEELLRRQVLVAEGSAADFKALIEDESVSKSGYSLKLADSLFAHCNISLKGRLDDIELMHYLLNPELSHKLDVLARGLLGVEMSALGNDPQKDQEFFESDLFAGVNAGSCSMAGGKACDDGPGLFTVQEPTDETGGRQPGEHFAEAAVLALLCIELQRLMREAGVDKLFREIEEPLERVLARMERCGVKVDMAALHESAGALAKELSQMEAKVREQAGEPDINLSSPKQVGVMLYEKLRIDPRAREKKSYPTDEDTLLRYADSNPIIYDILEYRAVKKLLSTYIEPFGAFVSPLDGRVHTTFNQALTATGRLSSSRPNLQNIPIRTERGRFIRKAFAASDENSVIVSADYSQIELRLMAHFCGDEHMLQAFREGRDVHAATASKIFKCSLEDVTPDMRRTAKTANFGIMYGISAFGLAERLRIPRVAAKKIIEDYFESFPLISKWIGETVEFARANGYVQTMYGRRRYLPDINSRNATVRALAERNAVNAPIQGTAADIIKVAMNRVDERMGALGLRARMVLQIHDELLFEAPRTELDLLIPVIKEEMENVLTLSVPLTVECNYGENWLEAH